MAYVSFSLLLAPCSLLLAPCSLLLATPPCHNQFPCAAPESAEEGDGGLAPEAPGPGGEAPGVRPHRGLPEEGLAQCQLHLGAVGGGRLPYQGNKALASTTILENSTWSTFCPTDPACTLPISYQGCHKRPSNVYYKKDYGRQQRIMRYEL